MWIRAQLRWKRELMLSCNLQFEVPVQATRSGLFDWPQPEPNSASAASNGAGKDEEQPKDRRHRQKRISATEEVLVKEEETASTVNRWTRRTRWDGSLTPIRKRIYQKAEWVQGK